MVLGPRESGAVKRGAILDMLQRLHYTNGNHTTWRELVEATGYPRNTVQYHVAYLEEHGLIRRHDHGRVIELVEIEDGPETPDAIAKLDDEIVRVVTTIHRAGMQHIRLRDLVALIPSPYRRLLERRCAELVRMGRLRMVAGRFYRPGVEK